ncbi:MAG: hypothetical protein CL424_04350, partial [Acidimicrobiaceae bacterium]|nr:hypothetical protein [Acidimicrobiaceae bacterium]
MSWRILVVEDEDDIREQTVDLLSGSVPSVEGIPADIRATGSFDQALHLLESEPFDVVVLDIRDQSVVDGSPTDDADSGLDV